MRSGLLDTLLTVEENQTTSDGQGGRVSAWTSVGTVRGSVHEVTARDYQVADRYGEAISHVVLVRGNALVQPGRRFRLGSRVLVIRGVKRGDGRGRVLVCDCVEQGL